MDKEVLSGDGVRIHYRITGTGSVALFFVHGWLGNAGWWNSQCDYFAKRFIVVQIDLAGHGQSAKNRQLWSSEQYAADIKAVADEIDARKIILIGHSMSGAYVIQASLIIPETIAIILVDTLRDLDQLITYDQAEDFMFSNYRKDFKAAVENIIPKYLFVETTPAGVQRRLQDEFLNYKGDMAIKVIEPLYKADIRALAKEVMVPVRAINSDYSPTNLESNRKYFNDFNYTTIMGTGHYPMLEKPDEFNRQLEQVLNDMDLRG
ncbi:MAG TPA: alpha/beta hydrolase [Bacteroidales bacterium]|nr:alpha/beta hydrolase [Bacteroidales bacterium]